MSHIINQIGSLTVLKSILHKNNISDFKSLKEVVEYQNSYSKLCQNVILKHEELLEKEKNNLLEDLESLEISIENLKIKTQQELSLKIKNFQVKLDLLNNNHNRFILKIFDDLKKSRIKRQILKLEKNFNLLIEKSTSELKHIQNTKETRYQFINSNFEEAVNISSLSEITEINRIQKVIKNLNPYIYGAFGEQKVTKKILELSDDFYLINDFDISFRKALYYGRDDEYIKSVQIDHILIGPPGVFLIETKNWSEKSLSNTDLYSPIKQIRRNNYALFKLINSISENLFLNQHHWGSKKITINNLLVFINNKPKEEFQYVKILNLDELINYIKYFKPILSETEIKSIKDYLLKLNK